MHIVSCVLYSNFSGLPDGPLIGPFCLHGSRHVQLYSFCTHIGNGDLGAAFAWPPTSPELLDSMPLHLQMRCAIFGLGVRNPQRIDIHIGHNAFFAAPVAGVTSCGYAPGGRKAVSEHAAYCKPPVALKGSTCAHVARCEVR